MYILFFLDYEAISGDNIVKMVVVGDLRISKEFFYARR
jgi:hypothetical protein